MYSLLDWSVGMGRSHLNYRTTPLADPTLWELIVDIPGVDKSKVKVSFDESQLELEIDGTQHYVRLESRFAPVGKVTVKNGQLRVTLGLVKKKNVLEIE